MQRPILVSLRPVQTKWQSICSLKERSLGPLNHDSVFDSNLNQVFLPHFLFCIGHILYQYKKFRVALKSWFVSKSCSILDFSSGQPHCIVVLISSP